MSTEVPARRATGSTSPDGETAVAQPKDEQPSAAEKTAPGRHWLSGRPFRGLHLLEAAVIGLAVIALAYVYRSIIVPTDPWHYVRSAMYFPSDGWVALGYTRYGIVLANIPTVWLFGNAQATYYFWPILSSGLMAAGVYLLGRRFWGPVAG